MLELDSSAICSVLEPDQWPSVANLDSDLIMYHNDISDAVGVS